MNAYLTCQLNWTVDSAFPIHRSWENAKSLIGGHRRSDTHKILSHGTKHVANIILKSNLPDPGSINAFATGQTDLV